MDDEIFGGYDNNEDEQPQTQSDNNEAEVTEEATAPEIEENQEESETQQNDSYSQQNYYQQPYGQYQGNTNGQYQYNNGTQPNHYSYNQYNGNQYNQSNPYSAPAKPPKKNNSGMKVFIAIIAVIVVLAVALMIAIFAGGSKNGNINMPEAPTSSSGNSSDRVVADNVDDLTVSSASLEAGEAAVVAEIAQQYNVGILIYQRNSLYTEGSGVVVKEDNNGKYTYIITCAHVVNYDGVAVSVLMADGTEYSADVVGLDTRTDIAVVRIEATGLVKGEFADSDELVVGQTVYAVGNPGGSEFFGSVTNGIISAIGRPVSSSTGYEMECLQHTSAINPGNSGGALVNGEGKIIGINSMKIASTEYEGMGFAVPSDVVVEVFNSIIENGYVAGRAKLGISYSTPSNYSQNYAMYVQMKGLPSGTIVIAAIGSDSDLATKDVKVGDMITKVNGKPMSNTGMLADMIDDMSVGDNMTLTIVRVNTDDWSQTEFNVTVSLVEDRGEAAQSTTPSENSQNPYGDSYEDWYEYFKDYYGY
ncbi:MAG: trypsin-like peptidase domain-containing protein [Clostridia bacterium]|nr:trypsin-like peptidase domain-containing protein [Clostridia bacterium]